MPRHDRHGSSGLGFGLKIGTLGAAIAGAHQVGELAVKAKQLWDVKEDNMIFVRLLRRVIDDLAETERLLALKDVKWALSKSPKKVEWIRSTIHGVKEALESMQKVTGKVGKKVESGAWLGLWKRIAFVADGQEKLVLHSQEVARHHDGLLHVLSFLAQLEPLACCDEDKKNQQRGGDHREGRDDRWEEDRFVQHTDVYQEQQRPRTTNIVEEKHYYSERDDNRHNEPVEARYRQEVHYDRGQDQQYEERIRAYDRQGPQHSGNNTYSERHLEYEEERHADTRRGPDESHEGPYRAAPPQQYGVPGTYEQPNHFTQYSEQPRPAVDDRGEYADDVAQRYRDFGRQDYAGPQQRYGPPPQQYGPPPPRGAQQYRYTEERRYSDEQLPPLRPNWDNSRL